MERLDVGIEEIPDWTCCGPAPPNPSTMTWGGPVPRNLALAEKASPGLDILVPCSACYLNLLKAQRAALANKAALAGANALIGHEGLAYTGKTGRVRHLLDVLLNDVGPKAIGDAVQKPLTGISVAPYYGCQILRPYSSTTRSGPPPWNRSWPPSGPTSIPGTWAAGAAGPRSWPPTRRRPWPPWDRS
jgi:heterodisulfide reductase subunit B